jgi:hypothetical protein
MLVEQTWAGSTTPVSCHNPTRGIEGGVFMTQPDSTGPLDCTKPPAYFSGSIDDAERLMKYAAEIGIEVSDETRSAILHARAVFNNGWTEEIAAKLLAALTSLAARLKPVNAESLKAYHDDTRPTVREYLRIAIILACIIVPASVASFMSSALSSTLRADIVTANDLAVKLRSQLGPAPPLPAAGAPAAALPPGVNEADVIAELQQYASTIRVIYARARELNWLILPRERDPYSGERTDDAKRRAKFELPPALTNLYEARDDRTAVYQDVRYFAQTVLNDSSVFYGALTSCVLPVLYALLGTCAYLLRTFEDQMTSRTFTPSVANSARFLIAAIGGAVVGLFNNFTITEQASIPPLALAFLEVLLKAITKSTTPDATTPPVGRP